MQRTLLEIKRLAVCQYRHVARFNRFVIPAYFFTFVQGIYSFVDGSGQVGVSTLITAVEKVGKATFPLATLPSNIDYQSIGVNGYQFKGNIKRLAVGWFHVISFEAIIA